MKAGGLQLREESVGKTAASGFGIFRRGKTDPFCGPWKHPALKTRLDLAFSGSRVYVTGQSENENGNSGLYCEGTALSGESKMVLA
jgi:hypothetical protein